MQYIEELIDICKKFGCRYINNALLRDYTTFKVGGQCRVLISINGADALKEIIVYLNENSVRYFILGKGSNIIASDEGFDGVILYIGKDFSGISLADDETIECQSGASLKSVCLYALENSLSGLEFAWGIPGTVGGGLYMNAGAYGGEMSDVVLYADYIDCDGTMHTIEKDKMLLSYRHSYFSDNPCIVITKIGIKLNKGNYNEIKSKMDELMRRRIEKQPLNYASAGSTFKRPEKSYASYLIEQCGLKGVCVGDAQVSEKHSGFIVNKGNATCNDILELVSIVKKKVKDDTGYELELEPKIIK